MQLLESEDGCYKHTTRHTRGHGIPVTATAAALI
jgi:hypothetical protein